ncbi:MAG: FYDLN acid domain-containing protein [Janthinobacterium lividum]
MKPEWGSKRACQKCAAYFYDLNKSEFQCPKCGADFTPADYVVKTNKSSDANLKKDLRKKLTPFAIEDPLEDEDIDVVIDTDLEDEDLIEDVAELEDEDVHTVIKHEEEID